LDPYLEAQGRWPGFRNLLIAACNELLNRDLPEAYVGQVDARIALVSFDDEPSRRVPDIMIGREEGRPTRRAGDAHAATATLEPVTMRLLKNEVEVREAWIDIFHLPEMELVTSIKILSPSNKGGTGRADYIAKRNALIDRPVNLVEIDLLLSGSRMPISKGTLRREDYVAIVARAERRPQADVYTWPLRHPLPVLPIPLRAPDPDVTLDLGEAFRMTYDRGGYPRVMRYGRPLPESLPISPEDRAWAVGLGH
jgi:hypothetical protein